MIVAALAMTMIKKVMVVSEWFFREINFTSKFNLNRVAVNSNKNFKFHIVYVYISRTCKYNI